MADRFALPAFPVEAAISGSGSNTPHTVLLPTSDDGAAKLTRRQGRSGLLDLLKTSTLQS